jgi:hypothetical protein
VVRRQAVLALIFSCGSWVMKPTALLLNLFVSIVSFIQFYRGGYFNGIYSGHSLASVPLAYVVALFILTISIKNGHIIDNTYYTFFFLPTSKSTS